MSSARCCRLVQILGLNRLDGIDGNLPATLGPAADWIELEERRRVFWVAFSIDAQSSIATGWPSLINTEDVSFFSLRAELVSITCLSER